ncbi:DNA alkylation repair protein [Raineyella sp. LH-20]|uniref:DNA alkylation repair protein n=1 Tax=Raineyella sp. LH-20 TaxID=3081204 RepID=UPI0029534FE3|nr:DNA alkylation repair protein [Raineyella sp. LH-20]WOP17712.1 DNA alkylation repair protein [Raineyella sp. LH-20]
MTDPLALAEQIDAALRAQARPGRAAAEKAYLKSDLEHYGTPMPAIRATVRTLVGRGRLAHDDLIALVEALWAVPVHERRAAAVEVLVASVGLLRADDIALLERLLRASGTWALVDRLAASVVGSLVEHDPTLSAVVDRWATDDDFWIRRSALLALLGPLRRGDGDFDRFARYADTMLEEKEFFVRKAIGWVLRDTGRRRPELVFDWLLPRARRASGVTVREAVKPLSAAQRDAITAAQRSRRPDDPPGRAAPPDRLHDRLT